METNSVKKMLPLQLSVEMYQRLTELGTSEKLSVAQTVRSILNEAVKLNGGQATLQDIYAVFSQVNSQAATQPSRPLRISCLKR